MLGGQKQFSLIQFQLFRDLATLKLLINSVTSDPIKCAPISSPVSLLKIVFTMPSVSPIVIDLPLAKKGNFPIFNFISFCLACFL